MDMVFSLLPFFATRTVCILGSKQEEDNAVQSQRPEAACDSSKPKVADAVSCAGDCGEYDSAPRLNHTVAESALNRRARNGDRFGCALVKLELRQCEQSPQVANSMLVSEWDNSMSQAMGIDSVTSLLVTAYPVFEDLLAFMSRCDIGFFINDLRVTPAAVPCPAHQAGTYMFCWYYVFCSLLLPLMKAGRIVEVMKSTYVLVGVLVTIVSSSADRLLAS